MINKKRINKRKILVKKLVKSILNKYNKNIKIQVIDKDSNKGIGYNFYDSQKKLLGIDLSTITDRIKNGYYGYYDEREKKLDFVKGNRHLALRFIIYHEIGHSLDKKIKAGQFDNWDMRDVEIFKQKREIFADNFAIKELKNEGLLK